MFSVFSYRICVLQQALNVTISLYKSLLILFPSGDEEHPNTSTHNEKFISNNLTTQMKQKNYF